jgi:hypothetical protein
MVRDEPELNAMPPEVTAVVARSAKSPQSLGKHRDVRWPSTLVSGPDCAHRHIALLAWAGQ